jgi:hypothetical protein
LPCKNLCQQHRQSLGFTKESFDNAKLAGDSLNANMRSTSLKAQTCHMHDLLSSGA